LLPIITAIAPAAWEPSGGRRYDKAYADRVFDIKGIAGYRRERIKAAVVAGGKHTKAPHEAWIAADPFNGARAAERDHPCEGSGVQGVHLGNWLSVDGLSGALRVRFEQTASQVISVPSRSDPTTDGTLRLARSDMRTKNRIIAQGQWQPPHY
jgi:hypothetical protein